MRRWTVRILLCLILGAITTVAVAWGHAAFVDGHPLGPSMPILAEGVSRPTFPTWKVTISELRGSTVLWHQPIDATTPRPPQTLDANPPIEDVMRFVEDRQRFEQGLPPARPRNNPIIDVPYWSRAAVPPERVVPGESYMEDARGWPFRSMLSYEDVLWTGTGRTRTSAKVGNAWRWNLGGTQGVLGLPRGLPLKPIGPGFLADTLIFAAVPFAVMSILPTMRALRLRRGRCPQCGYDLRHNLGAGCPECGWNRADSGSCA